MSSCAMKIKDLTTTSESLLKVIVLLKTPLILCQSIGGYLTNKIVGNMFLIHLSVLKMSLNLNWLSIEGNFLNCKSNLPQFDALCLTLVALSYDIKIQCCEEFLSNNYFERSLPNE